MYHCNKCIHFTGLDDCGCDVPDERVWWKKNANSCENFELKEPITVEKLQKQLKKYAPGTVIINAERDICTELMVTNDKKLQIC